MGESNGEALTATPPCKRVSEGMAPALSPVTAAFRCAGRARWSTGQRSFEEDDAASWVVVYSSPEGDRRTARSARLLPMQNSFPSGSAKTTQPGPSGWTRSASWTAPRCSARSI
jgi:hypothetical protein